jgi:hypothetical protein
MKDDTEIFCFDIIPDWSQQMTPSQMGYKLLTQNGNFEFKGPGWYFSNHTKGSDTFLILPVKRSLVKLWAQDYQDEEIFNVMIFNGRNPCDSFNTLINAPIRKDER